MYALPGDDPAVLFTFSDVIEVNVRTEDENGESSIFPDEGLAILVHPSVLEVSQDEQIGAVLLVLPEIEGLFEVLVDKLVLLRLLVAMEQEEKR